MKFKIFFFTFLCLISTTLSFDYIIIGGGASGCGLAAQLSKKGSTLLIERGKTTAQEPNSQNAAGWPNILGDIISQDDAAEDIRTTEGVWTIAPRILGGGTSLNVGVWVRENADFFAGLGINMDWAKVSQSFVEIEAALQVVPNPRTNVGTQLATAFSQGGGFASGPLSLDRELNSTQYTYSTFQQGGERVRRGAASLLDFNNPNLVVLTQHRVNSIVFDTTANPPRAIGVDVSDVRKALGSFKIKLNPGGRLFLTAGAIHSPYILLRSGVAPANFPLSSFGITRVATNNQVGKNFIDKPVCPVNILTLEKPTQTMVEVVANSEKYVMAQTSGGNIISALAPVSAAFGAPSTRTNLARLGILVALNLLGAPVKNFLDTSFQIITFLPSPQSRGEISLKWESLNIVPKVTGGYYAHPDDVVQHALNLQKTHQIITNPAFQSLVQSPNVALNYLSQLNTQLDSNPDLADHINLAIINLIPTIPPLFDPNDFEGIKNWIKTNYVASYHSASSLSQAVDSNLDVLGVSNVKAIDASVLKISPRTHPQATLIMMGDYFGKETPACSGSGNCKVNCEHGTWNPNTRSCQCNLLWTKPLHCIAGSTFCPCSCFLLSC